MDNVLDTQNRWVTTAVQICTVSTIWAILGFRIAHSALYNGRYSSLRFLQRARRLSSRDLHLLAIFIAIWVNIFCCAFLQNNLNLSEGAHASIALTISLWTYAVSKMAIYSFFIERAHFVRDLRRRDDYIYCFNIILMLVGLIVVFLAQFYHRVGTKTNRGFLADNSLPVILLGTYDVFITLYCTSLFIYPILRSTLRTRKLTRNLQQKTLPTKRFEALIVRTAIGALLIALFTIVNTVQLVVQRHKLGAWICLSSWNIQQTLEAVVLHIITNDNRGSSDARSGPSQLFAPATDAQNTSSITIKNETVNLDIVEQGHGGNCYYPTKP